jgi:hypothetical protein
MTHERLDAHTGESECWLFPCGLSLTIRIQEYGDAYLAIQTRDPTRREPVPAAIMLNDSSQDADPQQSPESKLAFIWRQLMRLTGMCIALFEVDHK